MTKEQAVLVADAVNCWLEGRRHPKLRAVPCCEAVRIYQGRRPLPEERWAVGIGDSAFGLAETTTRPVLQQVMAAARRLIRG